MKKLTAILLVLVLALTILACSKTEVGGKEAASSPPPSAAGSPEPAGSAAGSDSGEKNLGAAIPTDFTAKSYFGFFNPNLDYKAMNLPEYKFGFVSLAWDDGIQLMANNFEAWAKAYGSTLTCTSSDGDAEKAISNVELYCSQGFDGLLVNATTQFMDRVAEICADNDVPWWSLSEIPRLSDGTLNHPSVKNDDVAWGEDLVKQQIEWMKENVEGWDPAKTMIISMSLTTLTAFENRSLGCEQAWKKYAPEAKFEIADGLAEGGISAEVGYNMAATRYTANPDIKYWIYAASVEFFAVGALRFVEEKGIEDNVIIASIGAVEFIKLLDNGTNGPWVFALFSDFSIGWNCCFNALYAHVAGWCSFEDLWPDVERLPGDKYPILDLGWARYDKDTYKDYLAFCDAFTGLNNYPNYTWSGKRYPVLASEMT